MRELQAGNRPGPSLYSAAKASGAGFVNPSGTGQDLTSYFRKMQVAAGVNDIFQVNDTQTIGDWTESDGGTLDADNDTGGRVETNELKLTSTGACDGTQFVDTDFINESAKPFKSVDGRRQMDWRDTRYIGFWVTNKSGGDFSTAGELKMALVSNDGVESDQVNVQAVAGTYHQWFQIDMVAEGWDLVSVEKIRFYANVGGSESIYINDIIRYDLSYGRGPLYGGFFPIASGTTLSDGDLVAWSIDGLEASTSSAAPADLGPVKLIKDGLPVASATGNAKRNVWGLVPSAYIFIARSDGSCTAGDLAEWQAAGHLTDVTTTETGKGFAMALETDGAAEDDIMFSLTKPGKSA